MNQQLLCEPSALSTASLMHAIVQLARAASIEINTPDAKHLDASRAFLAPGKTIYVSHLPKQSWKQTEAACLAVRAAGFEPVPHMPVRLIPDAETLDRILADLTRAAQIEQVLLIAGDYPQAIGQYSTVKEVLRSGLLQSHGLTRVSIAGHPEGHPKVALDEIRRAESEKATLAAQSGLKVTFVTQFCFEHKPFLEWVGGLRSQGIQARVVVGLAGPAKLATLLRFAVRCGAGPSIRALGAHPSALMKLIGDHGPDSVLRGLAQARSSRESDFSGIHLFCFGGFLRTCEWLHAVANGQFVLNDSGGFNV
jgi:methylenetetrahydrofolate reductase (NADPH)